MKKIKYSISALLAFGLVCLSGCKEFLDVNVDPNNAADVQVEQLLPSAQAGIAFALGNDLQIKGGLWAQYWTQNPNSSQYRSLDQYSLAASEFDATWSILYSDVLQDAQEVVDKAKAGNKKQYIAIATLLQAYTFQLATDLFGDVPFNEALKGDATIKIASPKYDKQKDIYTGLLKMVDEAIALINVDDPVHPGTDDLIYAKDPATNKQFDPDVQLGKWLRFGNTLKLKIAMRLSEVDPAAAAAAVASLQGKEFLHSGESALIKYSATGGKQNPLYSAIAGPVLSKTQNLVASRTAISFLEAYGDPRMEAFYSPAANGAYIGFEQGAFALEGPSAIIPGSPVAIPSPLVGANANKEESASAPVKLLTDYESKFLQAEAMARGWLTGDAKTLYEEGIQDNFIAYGLTATDASDYFSQEDIEYPSSGTVAEQVENIITQKWIAMNGNQSIEAWTEWRRTGYPSFLIISKASNIGADRMPGIFLYPTVETQRNPNTPSQHLIYNKVWWDTK